MVGRRPGASPHLRRVIPGPTSARSGASCTRPGGVPREVSSPPGSARCVSSSPRLAVEAEGRMRPMPTPASGTLDQLLRQPRPAVAPRTSTMRGCSGVSAGRPAGAPQTRPSGRSTGQATQSPPAGEAPRHWSHPRVVTEKRFVPILPRPGPCRSAGRRPAQGRDGGTVPTLVCPRGDTLHTHTACSRRPDLAGAGHVSRWGSLPVALPRPSAQGPVRGIPTPVCGLQEVHHLR